MAIPDSNRDRLPVKTEEIQSSYANNTRFEPSVWDLKILFGQLDASLGKGQVDWHTALTMPWIQAKIFSYLLQLNIAVYEQTHGKIRIPLEVMPAAPSWPEDDTRAQEIMQVMSAIYQRFLEDQQ